MSMSKGLLPKPVTPGSLKALMALEGLAILLLGSWLYVEYNYSSSFHNVLNDLVFTRITLWTPIIGLSAGLVGAFVAIGVWRSLRQMRSKIETLERDLMEASKRILEKPSALVHSAPTGPVEFGGPLAIVQPQATSLALTHDQASAMRFTESLSQ